MSRAASSSRRARGRRGDLVIFLGPSWPAAEARRLAGHGCRVLPPARAGDVFAVLPERPLAIALVDGLFEAVPSVWHHELLAAQAAGVQLFGGASMGALRAAELGPWGMVGVGHIFEWYRDGAVEDDGEVALLHAGAEHGWRALTVPLVDVRGAVRAAVARGDCGGGEGRAVLAAAAGLFYQERTWPSVLAAARLGAPARARLAALLPALPSQKAEDARATILAAAEYVRARASGCPAPPHAQLPPLPSHARHLQLASARSIPPGRAAGGAGGRGLRSERVLRRLAARPDAARLAEQGLRRALLAALARSLGLVASEADRAEAERAWLESLGVAPEGRAGFLAACGLDEGSAAGLAEGLALEGALLAAAGRVLPDGPSRLEGLALGARLTGAWAEVVARQDRPSQAVRPAHPAPRRPWRPTHRGP